jgi:hypothetical protein
LEEAVLLIVDKILAIILKYIKQDSFSSLSRLSRWLSYPKQSFFFMDAGPEIFFLYQEVLLGTLSYSAMIKNWPLKFKLSKKD